MTTIAPTMTFGRAVPSRRRFDESPVESTSSAPRPRLRITDRGRVLLAALLAIPLAIGIAAIGAGLGANATDSDPVALHYVTVQSGDSLWSIANRVAPKADPRDAVAELERVNGLDSAVLQPGQRLAIPSEYDR